MSLFIVHFLAFSVTLQSILLDFTSVDCSYNITKAFTGIGMSFQEVVVQRMEMGLEYFGNKPNISSRGEGKTKNKDPCFGKS